MSRVIIKDLYRDMNNCNMSIWSKCANIEVVPRKMVEMIIEECKRNEIFNHAHGNYCAADNLQHIRECAESLLKQFEEDSE